jgi:hypothetical protein
MADYDYVIVPATDPTLRRIRREFAAFRGNKARAEARFLRQAETRHREQIQRNRRSTARAIETLTRSYERQLREKLVEG